MTRRTAMRDTRRGFTLLEVLIAMSLFTILGLGLWMPIDVSYRCKAPGVPTGDAVIPP